MKTKEKDRGETVIERKVWSNCEGVLCEVYSTNTTTRKRRG